MKVMVVNDCPMILDAVEKILKNVLKLPEHNVETADCGKLSI
jgi:hypothetical protein